MVRGPMSRRRARSVRDSVTRGPRACGWSRRATSGDATTAERPYDGDASWMLDAEHDCASARFAAVGGGSRHGRVLLVIRIPSVRTRRAVGVLSGAQQALFRAPGASPGARTSSGGV